MIEPVNEEFATPVKRMPDEFKFVKLRCDGGVARMTLNRPEHNLLNEAMLREMADGISYAGEREDTKLIVLDSDCKVFCGGIDVGEYTSQRVFQMLDAFHATFAGMLELGKPVVCVVSSRLLATSLSPRPKRASLNLKSASAFFHRSPPRFYRSWLAPKSLSSWSSPVNP